MESPNLRIQPGVEAPLNFAPLVRVGAVDLNVAAIANVGGRSVASDAPLVIQLDLMEILTRGAHPKVRFGMVGETGQLKLLGAPVGMACEELQSRGDPSEEHGVTRRQQNLWLKTADHGRASLEASTSVNKISAGSSMVTRGALCRIPSQVR